MLTKRQKQVLDYIKHYTKKKGYAPSLTEIQNYFNLASVSTAHHHVENLKNLGYLVKQDNLPRALDIAKEENFISIPILGTIAAGEPIEAIEERDESIAIPQSHLPKSKDIYALKVRGDSMIDENIHNNDIVIIKKQNYADNGDKVVALIDKAEATLKKFFKEKGKIRLQPANPRMNPIFVKPSDLLIQGKVVTVVRSSK